MVNCTLCPNSWKFKYAHKAAGVYGKYNLEKLRFVYEAQNESDIPSEIYEQFKNTSVEFLYQDEDMVLFGDVDQDKTTHLLLMPTKHIESWDILKFPEIIHKFYCFGNKMIDLLDMEEVYMAVSAKHYYQVKHFHMHIQSESKIPDDIKDRLYPYFYKDSEYYLLGD